MTSPEQLLELALKSGAEAAEVFQSTSRSTPVSFEANRLKQVENIEADGVALRLWRNGQPGLAVAYGEVELQALVDRALALSQLNVPEERQLTPIAHPKYPTAGKVVPVQQLVDWGNAAIDQIRAAQPEVLCGGGWDCETETTRLINSAGLDCRYEDITLSGYLEVEMVRGDDFLNISDGATDRGDLDSVAFVQRILQHLIWCEVNVDPAEGRLPVLLTAKAMDLLWDPLYAALNGKRVLEKSSPWSDRLGQFVLAPQLTLRQDPNFGPFGCPFDDEGAMVQPLMLVEAGQLQHFYADAKTGRELGTGSTGNGFRSDLGSYPTPRLCNFLVEPGQQSFAQLVASIEDGLILDQVLGGGPGISGDFSVNVDLGYRVKQGQIVGRVKDTMVAGNVYQTLQNPVMLGNDADWSGSCWTPSAIVDGLSVVGRSVD